MTNKILIVLTVVLSSLSCSQKGGPWQEASLADIRPEGWLLQKLETQKEGLTGHPEALSYPYNTCLWDGEIPRMGTHGQDWWRYEQTAYYTDGLLRLGYLLQDDELTNKGEAGIHYTLAHPWENGRLGARVINNTWPFAVFFRAVKAAYDVAPSDSTLEALSRHYHSIPMKQLVRKRDIISVEGMLWTAAKTGDKALVAKADSAFRFRKELLEGVELKRDDRVTPEFLQAEEPYKMHGVTMSEMLKLPILLYAATGDDWYRNLAVSSLDRLYAEDGLPDGLFTSAEWLQGLDIRHSHETCNAIDMSWTLGCFLEVLKDARYADMLEKIVFNAGSGSVTRDFKALQYYSSVNQFLATGTSNHNKDNYCSTWMAYRPTHQTECCAGNIHRLYPNYAARMWLRGDGEAVAALYGPSRFRFSGDLSFIEETDYPYGETISITSVANGRQSAKLTLRIPAWCEDASLTINGKPSRATLKPGSFVTIDRKWSDGDKVELRLPAKIQKCTAYGGGIYFQCGPLLYSYAIPAEWKKDTKRYANMNGKYPADDNAFPCWDIQPSGPWNFAVASDVEASIVNGDDAPHLRIPVHPIGWSFDEGPNGEKLTPDLPHDPVSTGPEQMIELVPYGETTLRLTVFPVLGESLRVMSFNVRTSAKDDGENSWAIRRSATTEMLKAVEPDVFGVQEAMPDQIQYILETSPGYRCYGLGRDGGEDGEHASVFYNTQKLEMQDCGTWWLSETPDVPSIGWDAKYSRTATWVLLKDKRSGKEFYFVNTHLDHKGADARRNGLAMIVDKVREKNSDVPLVLVGDFNVEPDDPCLAALEGKMLDARLTAPDSDATCSFNGFHGPEKIIDYIYYSGFSSAARYEVVTDSFDGRPFISDHYPIVSTLIY